MRARAGGVVGQARESSPWDGSRLLGEREEGGGVMGVGGMGGAKHVWFRE